MHKMNFHDVPSVALIVSSNSLDVISDLEELAEHSLRKREFAFQVVDAKGFHENMVGSSHRLRDLTPQVSQITSDNDHHIVIHEIDPVHHPISLGHRRGRWHQLLVVHLLKVCGRPGVLVNGRNELPVLNFVFLWLDSSAAREIAGFQRFVMKTVSVQVAVHHEESDETLRCEAFVCVHDNPSRFQIGQIEPTRGRPLPVLLVVLVVALRSTQDVETWFDLDDVHVVLHFINLPQISLVRTALHADPITSPDEFLLLRIHGRGDENLRHLIVGHDLDIPLRNTTDTSGEIANLRLLVRLHVDVASQVLGVEHREDRDGFPSCEVLSALQKQRETQLLLWCKGLDTPELGILCVWHHVSVGSLLYFSVALIRLQLLPDGVHRTRRSYVCRPSLALSQRKMNLRSVSSFRMSSFRTRALVIFFHNLVFLLELVQETSKRTRTLPVTPSRHLLLQLFQVVLSGLLHLHVLPVHVAARMLFWHLGVIEETLQVAAIFIITSGALLCFCVVESRNI
mmetsp:Transcript_49399/g.131076  ORF Transcript_49399/g.131076 Transcript_49399/m.131076 type:complete len:511 (+) Transcript_49399:2989-4521(+)